MPLTQSDVDQLQADLIAAENALKDAQQAIIDRAAQEGAPQSEQAKLNAGQIISDNGMKVFHEAGKDVSIGLGITPQSGGTGKR